jgi:hypothetical protein
MSSLNQLIQTLAGVDDTPGAPAAPDSQPSVCVSKEYVEKLASAIEFIVDNLPTEPGRAEESGDVVKSASVEDATARLRASLKEKIAAKRESRTTGDVQSKLAKTVLGRLMELKDDRPVTEEETAEAVELGADEVFAAYSSSGSGPEVFHEPQTTQNPETAEAEVAEKAASVGYPGLPGVLREALGSSEPNDSLTYVGETKTAGVRGGVGAPRARKEATELLKERLMAMVGQEKVP